MSIARQLVSRYRGSGELLDIYGVILFTDAHPHVAKVLQDDAYWRAFEEISGERWAIFSARPKQGRTRVRKVKEGQVGMMVPTWEEPNENKPLIEEFELESTRDLPLLLIFAWDEETGRILKVTIRLDDSTLEGAYDSLQEAIRRVTAVFERADPETQRTAAELKRLVDRDQAFVKSVRFLKKTVPFAKWVVGKFLF